MEFGLPKEIRDRERRVALTPSGVLSLTRANHAVYIERDAGAEAGFSDEAYRQSGGIIVHSAAEAYGRADVVVKVARPMREEAAQFRPGQTILSYFYLPVASQQMVNGLREKEITAIAFEMIRRDDGYQPVLHATSEVAGRLAPVIAGDLLTNDKGGRGVLLSGIPGVAPASVVILGAGILVMNAARAFLGLRSEVVILDRELEQLQMVDQLLEGRVTTMLSNAFNIRRATGFADVLIGAIQIPGARSPIVVTEEMVKQMRPGTVVIDFSINSGGCVATSRPTTLVDPTYTVHEVIHHCVPNITATVARTASYGLNNAALPYLRAIGALGVEAAIQEDSSLLRGVNSYQGKIANSDIAAALGCEQEVDLSGGVA